MTQGIGTHQGLPHTERRSIGDVEIEARRLRESFMSESVAMGLRWVGRAIAALAAAIERRRARRRTIDALSRLDARALRDIGIEPHTIEATVDSLVGPAQPLDQAQSRLGRIDASARVPARWSLDRRGDGAAGGDPLAERKLAGHAANRESDHGRIRRAA